MQKYIKNKTLFQKEVINKLNFPVHGLLTIAPRVGKTKLAIDIIKKQKPKSILWVTPSVELRDKDIPEEFIKWKAKTYLNKTNIITYKSLAKIVGFYDLIILDEYQFITEINSYNLINKKLKYNNIIGLSGTHPKSKIKNKLLLELNLNILHKVTIEEAVKEELIANYNINVFRCELDNKDKYIKSGNKNKTFYVTEQQKYNYLTKRIKYLKENGKTVSKFLYLERMRLIHNSKNKLLFTKKLVKALRGRKIVFSSNIKQSLNITNKVYNSKSSKKHLNDFLNEKNDILGLVNSGGVGFTYRNVKYFIITQINSNSNGIITQKIARSLVKQNQYVANIYIIVLENTVDMLWLEEALKDFKKEKIKYYKCNL